MTAPTIEQASTGRMYAKACLLYDAMMVDARHVEVDQARHTEELRWEGSIAVLVRSIGLKAGWGGPLTKLLRAAGSIVELERHGRPTITIYSLLGRPTPEMWSLALKTQARYQRQLRDGGVKDLAERVRIIEAWIETHAIGHLGSLEENDAEPSQNG